MSSIQPVRNGMGRMRKTTSLVGLVVLLAGIAFVGGGGAEAHPTPHEFTIANAAASEGTAGTNGTATMTISVDPPPVSGEVIEVDWATSAIGTTASASADATIDPEAEDYQVSSGTAQFEELEGTQDITIPIGRDNVGEA